MQLKDVCQWLEQLAPAALAEDWDNVGLLAGDPHEEITAVMTCLTITPATVAEAVRQGANLVVTHHPMPFRPLKRLTPDSTAGGLLLQLIRAGISIYSPHTAFDSASEGINSQLAHGLGLQDIQPLVPAPEPLTLGSGRYGRLEHAATVSQLVKRLRDFLSIDRLRVVGDVNRTVQYVAVACGSAGEFFEPARRLGCELLVTGETSFHTCLEAEARHIGLLLVGHYASERFAVETLADKLATHFPECTVWASRNERDPLRWVE